VSAGVVDPYFCRALAPGQLSLPEARPYADQVWKGKGKKKFLSRARADSDDRPHSMTKYYDRKNDRRRGKKKKKKEVLTG